MVTRTGVGERGPGFLARIEGAAESRWVAIVSRSDGRMELFTVLDEGFESQ
jgi:hypothetical protein